MQRLVQAWESSHAAIERVSIVPAGIVVRKAGIFTKPRV
jgi:hypothetical protein